ncbi:MAG: hypothetical protein ACXW5J_22610 [Thermoanaerobaculia bacterium]
MRFTIEQRNLTDDSGRPVAANAVTFHTFEAADVDEAVRLFVKKRDAQIIGGVMTFPGFQAVATMRDPGGSVYTLQVTPASGRHFVR